MGALFRISNAAIFNLNAEFLIALILDFHKSEILSPNVCTCYISNLVV